MIFEVPALNPHADGLVLSRITSILLVSPRGEGNHYETFGVLASPSHSNRLNLVNNYLLVVCEVYIRKKMYIVSHGQPLPDKNFKPLEVLGIPAHTNEFNFVDNYFIAVCKSD